MWRVRYDDYVRRMCKERSLIYPKFGTKAYTKFGGKMPMNAGVLQNTLDRIHVGDIEKEHGHYLTQHVYNVSPQLITQMTGFGGGSDFDGWSVSSGDFDAAEGLIDFNEVLEESPFAAHHAMEQLRREQGLPTATQFLTDSDDDERTPPVAHRTRSHKSKVFSETSTDMFGSPF